MKVRHKTPTLVSMWMLDVFCCALGCVTFLWLLNNRQASDQTVAAASTQVRLDQTRTELADARKQMAGLNADAERLSERLKAAPDGQTALAAQLDDATREGAVLRGRLDEASRTLNAVRKEADATKKFLATTEAKAASTAAELASARQAAAAKDKELAAALARAKEAEAAMAANKQEIADLIKQASSATAKVDDLAKLAKELTAARLDLEAKYLALQKEMAKLEKELASAKTATDKTSADLATLKADGAKAGQELAAARKRIAELETQLAAAGMDKAQVIDLQGKNAKLADKVDQLQKQSENRFAGIATTGRRVAFMVDMSGSMTKTDLNTENKEKWPLVCETVGKIMRSIPTLDRYQVVVFSDDARWLLPGGGEWLEYDGEKSITDVKTELLKIRPNGATNLHAAFDLSFRLRAKGLDTIYLFSDGLPTVAPGLTQAEQALGEEQIAEVLSPRLLRDLRQRWNYPAAGGDRVKINSVGFFYQSPSVGAFLWSLSRDNDGSFVGMSRP